ncbi:hypothetical protein SDJN03_09549, partial [Cucurbita argyrosperma subsp. sororia]
MKKTGKLKMWKRKVNRSIKAIIASNSILFSRPETNTNRLLRKSSNERYAILDFFGRASAVRKRLRNSKRGSIPCSERMDVGGYAERRKKLAQSAGIEDKRIVSEICLLSSSSSRFNCVAIIVYSSRIESILLPPTG